MRRYHLPVLLTGALSLGGTLALAAPPPKPASRAAPPAALEIREWRYRDGLEPSATDARFDDSKWEVIQDPATPRGKGGASFGWYRAVVTVPETLGGTPIAGKPLRLSVLANDYAEVWVNGNFEFHFDPEQPPSAARNRPLGYEIAGFNKANVVDLGIHKPGDKLTVAVLVINGPLGKPVGKYYLHHARLELGPSRTSR